MGAPASVAVNVTVAGGPSSTMVTVATLVTESMLTVATPVSLEEADQEI